MVKKEAKDWIVISVDQFPEKIIEYAKSERLSKTPKSLCLKIKMDEKRSYYFVK